MTHYSNNWLEVFVTYETDLKAETTVFDFRTGLII